MKRIGIEKLVRWAWIEELSKVAPERVGRWAPSALGFANVWPTLVGGGASGSASVNRFGAVAAETEGEAPDPIALEVAAAVARLDDLVVEEPAEVDWFGAWGDLGALGAAATARAWDRVARPSDTARPSSDTVLQGLASSTVVRVAMTGTWPDWRGTAPSVVPEFWPNGEPKWLRHSERAVMWNDAGEPIRFDVVEIDGFDRRSRRPHRDAYRAMRLVPEPTEALAARIRWALLHAWFCRLAADLDGIGGRSVSAPERPATPWIM